MPVSGDENIVQVVGTGTARDPSRVPLHPESLLPPARPDRFIARSAGVGGARGRRLGPITAATTTDCWDNRNCRRAGRGQLDQPSPLPWRMSHPRGRVWKLSGPKSGPSPAWVQVAVKWRRHVRARARRARAPPSRKPQRLRR